MFRDRAYCSRSRPDSWRMDQVRCMNTDCDRFAGPNILRMAAEAKAPIGWADLKTSKCGFVADEPELPDAA